MSQIEFLSFVLSLKSESLNKRSSLALFFSENAVGALCEKLFLGGLYFLNLLQRSNIIYCFVILKVVSSEQGLVMLRFLQR